jgi:hypothetical protein
MKEISKKLELLPAKSKDFLKTIDINVQDVKRLTEDGKLLFLIKSNARQYVLKVNLPPTNFLGKIRRNLIGSIGFQKECLFYQNIKKFNSNGNYAEYFNNDKYNLLIEFLPRNNSLYEDFKEKDWRLIILALSDLNWDMNPPDIGLKNRIHRIIYGPQGMAFRVGIPTVRRLLGLKASIRYGYEIIRCIIKQPKLTRKCLSHNDFLPGNFIFSEDFNKVFIIDFQDITVESRWPFHDLIRLIWHSTNNDQSSLRKEIINSYLQSFPSDIIHKINIEAQVRFCVLCCIIHSLTWRLNNGHNYSEQITFLRSLLYNNEMDNYSNSIVDIINEYYHGR